MEDGCERNMIIFVFGADTFRSREKLQELVAAFVQKHDQTGTNVVRLDGATLDENDLSGMLRSQPFLGGGKRLVAIEGLLAKSKKGALTGLSSALSVMPESTVVIFWDEYSKEQAEKNEIFKTFSSDKSATVFNFSSLSIRETSKWIEQSLKVSGGKIEASAAQLLSEHCNGDLWMVHNELEKLRAYRSSEIIRKQDVALLSSGVVEENIFAITDAISAKNIELACKIIREQLEAGIDEFYILTMLARQFRILTQIRSLVSNVPGASKDDIAKTLKLHPFVAQKSAAAASAFAPKFLVEMLNYIFELERDMKIGCVQPELAIDLLLGKVAEL